MPGHRLPIAALVAALALAACRPAAQPPAEPAPPRADARPKLEGSVAAHYFGRQWPKNFIAGFRREHVAADFAQLRADGFDTVVLLVAWGDFQPVIDPCCSYDERAFERLHFLLGRAAAADLKVMLRLGYGWSFHPGSGDVGDRQHRLLNQPAARAAYQQFLQRLGREIAGSPQVVLGFMSWEDQWLRRIDESARADYEQYLATLPPDPSRPTTLPDPVGQAALFHGYWDWLVIEKLFKPAIPLFPALSYEARVDSEPRFEPGPDGQPAVVEWIGHDGMAKLPAGHPLTIYWAPFWGALNQGEQLPAARSLELFEALLEKSAAVSERPLFIDQYNFVDNTPGHENNAVLRPEEIASFLHQSVCLMKSHDVLGYGLWTTRDYAENPLHNPSFGYGLEAWTLERASGVPEAALESLPSGDFQLRLAAGDRLTQQIPARHGRMPRAGDALEDRACVEVDVTSAPAVLALQAGTAAPVSLTLDQGGQQRRCVALFPQPDEAGLAFSLTLESGALALREAQVFDHVQYGGLYDLDGRPGPLLDAVRRMNQDFRSTPGPARCD